MPALKRCSWRMSFSVGVAFSILAHLALLWFFLWQPVSRPLLIPDAIPIEIAMVAPFIAVPDQPIMPDLPDDTQLSEASVERSVSPPVTPDHTRSEKSEIQAFATEDEADLHNAVEPPNPNPNPNPNPET
ncbi:hypothetical protein MPL1_06375 [Methylophaga lonarensis MPL]|uniref:Uncharacterized protein n=1 Tax=Methylophaga lonarensis MPL TaxID=1286106 RepID=M7PS00_9GAMM|nr:hypothetical protein [Methylophaga lonarensis]EMR13204.1 hypothetical protein MPL1_06375 [Methylophaga lonarensis MPL]